MDVTAIRGNQSGLSRHLVAQKALEFHRKGGFGGATFEQI